MSRKTIDVTITAEGRDKDKVFVITEMPARQAEKWAVRAFLALARSGTDVPEEVSQAGIAGLSAFGLQALANLHFEDADSLMDEMFECVKIKPDKSNPGVVRKLVDLGTDGDDIEEVATRMHLRMEVLKLHVNFSSTGGLLKSTSTAVLSPTA